MTLSQFTEVQSDDVTCSRSQSYHAIKWDFNSEAATSGPSELHKMMEKVDTYRNDTKTKLTLEVCNKRISNMQDHYREGKVNLAPSLPL